MNEQMSRDLSDLYRAARLGDEETLQQLLQRDELILAKIPDGQQTPLHISALLGHVPFAEVLLNHNRALLIRASAEGDDSQRQNRALPIKVVSSLTTASAEGHGSQRQNSDLATRVDSSSTTASAEGDDWQRQYRDLTIRADSSGRTALHLASAEGNLQIVQILLRFNNEPCSVADRTGRVPLHYAAIRGRTEVVQELIMAKAASLSCVVEGEKSTVFHLCVTYNHLHTLETLVKLDYATATNTAAQPHTPIFTHPDQAGDTILHLAVMLMRVEVVRYLLSIPEIREIASLENNIGFTAHDILKRSAKDFKICEIQHTLTKAVDTGVVPPHYDGCSMIFKRIRDYYGKNFNDWLKHKENTWLEEMRGYLSTVSAFITTISFQGLINPPGGFIQQGLPPSYKENTTSSIQVFNNCTTIFPDNHTYCPGQALASSSHLHRDFENYLVYITVSFYSSLVLTLLLVSGVFPMKNGAVIYTASMGMCFTLTSLAAAYSTAINIITPSHLLHEKIISSMKHRVFYMVWTVFFQLIVMLISWRFCGWALSKSRRLGRGNGCFRCLGVLLIAIAFLVALFLPSSTLALVIRILKPSMY